MHTSTRKAERKSGHEHARSDGANKGSGHTLSLEARACDSDREHGARHECR